jgi:hypothetical protein
MCNWWTIRNVYRRLFPETRDEGWSFLMVPSAIGIPRPFPILAQSSYLDPTSRQNDRCSALDDEDCMHAQGFCGRPTLTIEKLSSFALRIDKSQLTSNKWTASWFYAAEAGVYLRVPVLEFSGCRAVNQVYFIDTRNCCGRRIAAGNFQVKDGKDNAVRVAQWFDDVKAFVSLPSQGVIEANWISFANFKEMFENRKVSIFVVYILKGYE